MGGAGPDMSGMGGMGGQGFAGGPDMGGAAGGSASGDDNVVDADFEVVDEDENK